MIFLEHESLYGVKGEVPDGEHLVPFGVANVMREGKDVTIVSYSKCVYDAMDAADGLENEEIDAEVIDLRTLNPLDLKTVVESVKKTGRAIVVYEGWRTGGAGAEIAAQIYEAAFDDLDAPIERIATLDVPMPYNKHLEKAALPERSRYRQGRRTAGLVLRARAPALRCVRRNADRLELANREVAKKQRPPEP